MRSKEKSNGYHGIVYCAKGVARQVYAFLEKYDGVAPREFSNGSMRGVVGISFASRSLIEHRLQQDLQTRFGRDNIYMVKQSE